MKKIYSIELEKRMTKERWGKVKNFEPFGTVDHFGDPYKMRILVITVLDAMTDYLKLVIPGSAVIVREGFATDGHSDNSKHYTGNAIDVWFRNPDVSFAKDLGLPLMKAFMIAVRFPWTGIGIYTNFAHNMLHLEIENVEHFTPVKLWWGNVKFYTVTNPITEKEERRYKVDYFNIDDYFKKLGTDLGFLEEELRWM